MALTPSSMVPLGTKAPSFDLPEPRSGHRVTLQDISSGKRAVLVMFICNHCPFVLHVNPELVRLGHDLIGRGVGVVAISSNDIEAYEQDGPEPMAKQAAALGYPFPYLLDEDQSVALAYGARCTPDFFLFDGDLALAYRGQLDSSRPGNDAPNDGSDLRSAVEALLARRSPDPAQRPSAGCNIKWRPGNEPD